MFAVGLRCANPSCGSVDPDPAGGFDLYQFVVFCPDTRFVQSQLPPGGGAVNHLPPRCSSRVAAAETAKQTTRNGPAGRSATAEIAMAATTAAMPLARARART